MKDMRKDPLWEELYQNLLNLVEGKTDGQQTGGAAPIEGYVRYDRNLMKKFKMIECYQQMRK